MRGMGANMNLEELRERLLKCNQAAQDLVAKAKAEKRDLSVEEDAELKSLLDNSDRIQNNIDQLERLDKQTAALAAPTGRKTAPEQPTPATRPDDAEPTPAQLTNGRASFARLDPVTRANGGYRTLGEFAMSVARHCKNGGERDARLERLAAATTYGSEGSGADGGFAVPPDFRSVIMQTVLGEDSLLGRCDQITVSGNSFTCPIDETTPWQTSGGIQATWDGEAVAATQSKPVLGERTTKLNKLRCLVPLTDEVLEDAAALDSYLRRKAPEKIGFKINHALINGTGVGMPLGILNSGCTVSVAKTSGQVAATLVGRNIIDMYSRMYGPSRSNAVWLFNQEIEPQLYKMSLPGTDNTGNAVTGWGSIIYMPPGGLSAGPYGTIMGRPAIPTQACSALGTKGDILFVDFAQYLALLKSGPNPRVDVSMHLWFDQDLTAFKFTLRLGGVPWWSTTVAALNGSNTYSPFVTLDTRS